MPDALPPDIQIVTTMRGTLYELPAHEVGCLRIVAVPMILFGLVFVGVGLYIALIEGGLIGWMTDGRVGGGGPVDPFQAMFGIPFFLSGLVPLLFGAFLLGGRSSIELRDDRLIATHRFGPIYRRKKIAISQIRKFQIKSINPDHAPQALDQTLSALNAILVDGGFKNLTWGYPKQTLRALANHLSERCREQAGAKLFDDDQTVIEVEESTIGDGLRDAMTEARNNSPKRVGETPSRPENAVAILERQDDGLTITIPAVGIRKGSKGMFGFSVFWNLFMAVFTGIWTFADHQGVGDLLFVIAILSLFWAVGIVMLIASINTGRRRAILDVVGDTLLITRQNIFKTRQQEVHRDNIQSIRRDKSGTEVNDVPILNLQVHMHEGKKIAMLSQLSNDELAWIAGELRRALDL